MRFEIEDADLGLHAAFFHEMCESKDGRASKKRFKQSFKCVTGGSELGKSTRVSFAASKKDTCKISTICQVRAHLFDIMNERMNISVCFEAAFTYQASCCQSLKGSQVPDLLRIGQINGDSWVSIMTNQVGAAYWKISK